MYSNILKGRRLKPNSLLGIEFIWQLEDYYEQKNLEQFLTLVSFDFRKGFLRLKNKLELELKDIKQLRLYILLRSRRQDTKKKTHSYDICWSKRCRIGDGYYSQSSAGKATLVFKQHHKNQIDNFLLYDICGDNPFI